MGVAAGWALGELGLAIVTVLTCAGCSSDTDSPKESSGGAPSNALPAQAGLTLRILKLATPIEGAACPTAGMSYAIGARRAPTSTDHGVSVKDGASGSSISCSVKGNGMFSFSGSISALGDQVRVELSDGNIGADFEGTANLAVYTPQLASTFNSVGPCTLSVISQQVKRGAIWADLTCSTITSPPSAACAANGTLVFENCDGS